MFISSWAQMDPHCTFHVLQIIVCKMQTTQYVYLLLYSRKFLRQSRAYLSIFQYKLCCEILFGGKEHCNKLCLYYGFLQWGHIDPHGTVNVTFFMVPEQG